MSVPIVDYMVALHRFWRYIKTFGALPRGRFRRLAAQMIAGDAYERFRFPSTWFSMA